MSKRFTATEKWDNSWFRKLGCQGRDLWFYLHDNCDAAGVIELDFEIISIQLGYEVTIDLIRTVLQNKCIVLTPTKVYLSGFIPFQYGTLSTKSNPHISVFKLLKKHQIDINSTLAQGYPEPPGALNQGHLGALMEEEEEKEEGISLNRAPATKTSDAAPKFSGLQALLSAWQQTLDAVGIEKKAAWESEPIVRLLARYPDTEQVRRALIGARHEPDYPPNFIAKKHLAVRRLLSNALLFDKCVSWSSETSGPEKTRFALADLDALDEAYNGGKK